MTYLRIVIPLYLFVWSMIFSENRYPLFRIMLEARPKYPAAPVSVAGQAAPFSFLVHSL